MTAPDPSPVVAGSRPRSELGLALGVSGPLLVGIALLMVGNGLQGSLLALRASIEGFGTTTTGVVMSAFYLGYLGGSLRAPRLVADVGHIRVFAALATIASSAVLVHAVFVSPLSWAVIRLVTGMCLAGLYVVVESWLNDSATNATRGSLMSIYMVVVTVGLAAGQLLLNVADADGFELFVVTSVLFSMALVAPALSVRSAPVIVEPARVRLVELWHVAPLGVLGSAVAGTSAGALFAMGVVYAQLVGLSVASTSVFMLVAIIGGAVLQWPLGWLSDRVDRRGVMIAMGLGTAAVAAVGAAGPEGTALLAVSAGVGALSLPLYAIANAHLNDWIERDRIVAAGSRLVLANGVGAVLGPVSASAAMDAVGPEGFFWFLGAVNGGLALYTVWRLTRRGRAPEATRGNWAAIPPRASPLVATLSTEAVQPPAEHHADDPPSGS
ncbi:MAG TPA: MFS transporter [Acidimicrobiales bacterium]|nr:MFS transporter [Acidimicrobiales bacterium]